MGHFYKTYAHVLVALLATAFLGIGVEFAGSALIGTLVCAGAGAVMLAGSVGTLMVLRSTFNLMQAGKLVQFGIFWGVWTAVIAALGFLLPGLFAVSSACLAGGFMVLAFLAALTLSGNIGMYAKRSWLPMRMPKE